FLNGGEEDVYLASADWMSRNLDKRVELMFPIETPEHKAKVLVALRAMFQDTVKARWLDADGVYRRRLAQPGESPLRVQSFLQAEAQRRQLRARERTGVSFVPEDARR